MYHFNMMHQIIERERSVCNGKLSSVLSIIMLKFQKFPVIIFRKNYVKSTYYLLLSLNYNVNHFHEIFFNREK